MNARRITTLPFLGMVLFVLLSTSLHAITITWTGAGDGISWEDPLNWDAGFLPTGDDRVIIEGTANVLLSSAVEARRVRLRDDAVLTVAPAGQITFPAANTVNTNLILLVNDAQLINNGTLNLLSDPEEDGIVLDNRGILTNNGSITIAQADFDAIWLLRRSTLINNSMITVQSADENGIDAEGQSYLENKGMILLQNSLDDAINMDEEASFRNEGTLRIEDTDDNDAIDMDGFFTFFENFGMIDINNVVERGEGIEIDEGFFINRRSGIINMKGISGDGILLEYIAEFRNRGYLSVEVLPGTPDDNAIEQECFTFFDNRGILEIETVGSDAVELECEFATFVNRPCGGVFINTNSAIDIQDPDALFRNNGTLTSVFDGTNNNEGTFRNNGIIEDPDGFMIAPNALTGTPESNQDMEMPTITCPTDISTVTDCFSGTATVIFTDPSGADNCNVLSVVCTPASGSDFPVGNTMVTCVVTDQAGNTGECTFNVEVTTPPVAAPVAQISDKAFCHNDELAANLANTGVSVDNTLAADEKVVWVLTSAPGGSAYSISDEFTTDNCGDPFKDFGELAVANSSRVIRVNDPENAPVGVYTFDAYVFNCTTGCISASITGFTIEVFASPTVDITADPDGDLCLNTLGVQYSPNLSATDGGTYSYAWCAYNSGDGSGTCFNGFDDNTAAMPSRDWVSSAGSKSVGLTVMSDIPGCTAEDLYSFEVVAPTMLACPGDQIATLITDDVTFECAAEVMWNNPTVVPGPCDPVTLTVTIDGNAPEVVTPDAPYMATFEELGTFMVTYELEDAVGNTSTCSFMVEVDGLPCGWVDNGGIGCTGNTSNYDLNTETFTVNATNCSNAYPYTSDNTAFVFTELCGDGEITALVNNVDGTGYAGVMMRDSEAPNAPMVAIGTNRVNRVLKKIRVLPSYPAFPQTVLSYDQFWVRLTRTGGQFRGYASPDGITWIPYIFQSINMQECLRIGLFTYSEKPDSPVMATFDNVVVEEYGGGSLLIADNALFDNTIAQSTSLQVFPNPTHGLVTLQLASTTDNRSTQLQIFNKLGQLVQQQALNTEDGLPIELDLTGQIPGMYFLHVLHADGTTQVEKVILE